MKACIVTVYNTENCGSFWQAFALQEFLKRECCDVFFLRRETKNTSHSKALLVRRALGLLLKGKVKRSIGMLKQHRDFEKTLACFPLTDQCGEDFDLCVLGSDTIWNLDSQYFADTREIYWGHRSKAKKTISYAASVANTEMKTLAQFPELRRYLEDLSAIGVRDEHTKALVSQLTENPVELVCDPTLLFDQAFYRRYAGAPQTGRDKSLFVYYFGPMSGEMQSRVREYARRKGLKIVVMGGSMKGDIQIHAFNPYAFIRCFSDAEYVVTNTFHGVLFSLIFERQACFDSAGKNKIFEILQRLGLSDVDYHAHPERELGLAAIDYARVSPAIAAWRDSSSQYLMKNVDGQEGL